MEEIHLGHRCKNLGGVHVAWSWEDCLCNPNLVAEVEKEMEEE